MPHTGTIAHRIGARTARSATCRSRSTSTRRCRSPSTTSWRSCARSAGPLSSARQQGERGRAQSPRSSAWASSASASASSAACRAASASACCFAQALIPAARAARARRADDEHGRGRRRASSSSSIQRAFGRRRHGDLDQPRHRAGATRSRDASRASTARCCSRRAARGARDGFDAEVLFSQALQSLPSARIGRSRDMSELYAVGPRLSIMELAFDGTLPLHVLVRLRRSTRCCARSSSGRCSAASARWSSRSAWRSSRKPIGNAAMTGVAIGVMLGESYTAPYVSMFGFCLLFGLVLNYTSNRTQMSADTLIGVFLSISLAVGASLLLCVSAQREHAHSRGRAVRLGPHRERHGHERAARHDGRRGRGRDPAVQPHAARELQSEPRATCAG